MRARGFTLIELTIAIVLLAIGLLALTGALARALHQTSDARSNHAALREAEGLTDSLAATGVAAAGAIERRGVALRWHAEACGLAECLRVTAATSSDTVSLVAALSGAP